MTAAELAAIAAAAAQAGEVVPAPSLTKVFAPVSFSAKARM